MKTDIDKLAVPYTSKGQVASMRWYKNQVRSLFENITPTSLMANRERLVNKIEPGNMYAFFYDPKMKEKLPYYDTFPLVIPIGQAANGFLALNFHYLPYMIRLQLLQRMMEYRTNKLMNDTTRIMATWKLLQKASTANIVKPAVKHYLTAQVGSRFLKIKADEWATAIMLPVEQFQKKTNQQVWNDSKKKIG